MKKSDLKPKGRRRLHQNEMSRVLENRVVEKSIDLLAYLPFLLRVPLIRRLPVIVLRKSEVKVHLDVESQIDWKDDVALTALLESSIPCSCGSPFDGQAKIVVQEDNYVRCKTLSFETQPRKQK